MTAQLLSIGKTAKLLGISIDTLRRWDKTGRLQSVRSGKKGHRYYKETDIDLFLHDTVKTAKQWAEAKRGVEPEPNVYCKTRDVFQARLETLQAVLSNSVSVNLMSLITAVAGEIGNNSFDHNLGNWPDIFGIYFSYSTRNRIVVLADRGQGILTTLKRVRPDLKSASQALHVAFSETVSGRAPETRGNGLKFVRDVITSNPLTLSFQTGDAYLQLQQNDTRVIIKKADTQIRGCIAVIGFESI